jgi:hypothetical protein
MLAEEGTRKGPVTVFEPKEPAGAPFAPRLACAAPALVTTTVYVSKAVPFGAVTAMVMVFDPTFSEIEPEDEPDDTVLPSTVIVELAWVAVGIITRLDMLLATLSA